MKRLLRDARGLTTVEYLLLGSMVVVAGVVAWRLLGSAATTRVDCVTAQLEGAPASGCRAETLTPSVARTAAALAHSADPSPVGGPPSVGGASGGLGASRSSPAQGSSGSLGGLPGSAGAMDLPGAEALSDRRSAGLAASRPPGPSVADQVEGSSWARWNAGKVGQLRRGRIEAPLMTGGPGHPIQPSDLKQGMLANCYLVAAYAAIAARDPDTVAQTLRDNGDGTYTVTFVERHWLWGTSEVEVEVEPEVPMYEDAPIFIGNGDELWPHLVEEAYVKRYGGGKYADIEYGSSATAMERIVGPGTKVVPRESLRAEGGLAFEDFLRLWHEGRAIVAVSLSGKRARHHDLYYRERRALRGTGTYAQGDLDTSVPPYVPVLYGRHAYFITDVNATTRSVTVRNPWGWSDDDKGLAMELPFEEFLGAFVQLNMSRPLGNPAHREDSSGEPQPADEG